MRKKIYFYPAKFIKEDKGYSVEFIDFNNIFTSGENLEDAYFMAQDVLFNMLPYYKNNLPEPTLNYMNKDLKQNEFITIVVLDILEHEKKVSKQNVNTTVTMPLWLKKLAEDNNLNFSKLLQEKLKQELNLN